jgi:uncharacterized protein
MEAPLPLAALVAQHTQGVDGSHDMAHIERVVANARRLAAAEQLPPAELRLAIAAAYCHDLDDAKYGGTPALARARAALAACEEAFTPAEVERACAVIGGVSYTGERASLASGGGGAPDRLTAIVQDADRLDAIGAHGIARCFCFGGARSRPLAESVAHFHEKLLKLRAMMKTQGGREEAEGRHAYMEGFLAQLAREASA